MPQVIVLAFATLDGFVEDPDGRGGTPAGGWAFRDGPPPPDHFLLGPKLDTGVLLQGRKTWELFSRIWPGRPGDFARALNRMPKLVASRTLTDLRLRESNEQYIAQNFPETQFGILMRVQVIEGETMTPDFHTEGTVLYQWPVKA